MIDNRYLYPVARTKALELELLDKTILERLMSCYDVSEAYKILSETAYASLLSDSISIESLIEQMIKKTKAYIDEISPEPLITGALYLKYDVHNVKVLLKSTLLGVDHDVLLSEAGTIPLEHLVQSVKNKDASFFNGPLKKCTQLLFDESLDVERIDRELDHALFETFLLYSKSEYMREIIVTQIDLINLRTLFRMKRIGYAPEKFKVAIVQNGLLESQLLMKAYEEPLSTLPEKLLRYGYDALVEQSIGHSELYEKYADDFLFEKVKRAKFLSFGIEPIIGYILAKERETHLLRMILVCKKNRVSSQIIRQRIGDVYV